MFEDISWKFFDKSIFGKYDILNLSWNPLHILSSLRLGSVSHGYQVYKKPNQYDKTEAYK